MQKHLTAQVIGDLQTRLETILKKVTYWQMLSEAELCFSVSAEKWSAAQCLNHLNSYGKYYLPTIEKAMKYSTKKNAAVTYKSSWLGNYFYELMLPETPKKKMK